MAEPPVRGAQCIEIPERGNGAALLQSSTPPHPELVEGRTPLVRAAILSKAHKLRSGGYAGINPHTRRRPIDRAGSRTVYHRPREKPAPFAGAAVVIRRHHEFGDEVPQ